MRRFKAILLVLVLAVNIFSIAACTAKNPSIEDSKEAYDVLNQEINKIKSGIINSAGVNDLLKLAVDLKKNTEYEVNKEDIEYITQYILTNIEANEQILSNSGLDEASKDTALFQLADSSLVLLDILSFKSNSFVGKDIETRIKESVGRIISNQLDNVKASNSTIVKGIWVGLTSKAANYKLISVTASDELYEGVIQAFDHDNGVFIDKGQTILNVKNPDQLKIIYGLSIRKYYYPAKENLEASLVAKLLEDLSGGLLISGIITRDMYYYLYACESFKVSPPSAVTLDDLKVPDLKEKLINDPLTMIYYYISDLNFRSLTLTKLKSAGMEYVSSLKSSEEISGDFVEQYITFLSEFIIKELNRINYNVIASSQDAKVEEFLTSKIGACRTIANYLINTLEKAGVSTKLATLYQFPDEKSAHSFIVNEGSGYKMFIFGDSGLIIVEREDPNKSFYIETDSAKFNKRFHLVNMQIVEKWKSKNFDWSIEGFNIDNYQDNAIPFTIDLKTVKSIAIGNFDNNKAHTSWEDVAYNKKNMEKRLEDNSKQTDFIPNLFVLGSMDTTYQIKYKFKNLSQPLKVKYYFSYCTEQKFDVKAEVIGGALKGNAQNTVSYGVDGFPENEKEALWEFTIIPDNNTDEIVLDIKCPSLSANGQKLFVDSIMMEKVSK